MAVEKKDFTAVSYERSDEDVSGGSRKYIYREEPRAERDNHLLTRRKRDISILVSKFNRLIKNEF